MLKNSSHHLCKMLNLNMAVKADYNDFIKAMFAGNLKEMNAYMNRTTFVKKKLLIGDKK